MNGPNEPVEFTRGDAERLKAIELGQNGLNTKLDAFLIAHTKKHVNLDKQVEQNSRFRRIVMRVFLWVLTTSGGAALLAVGAKAAGWLN